MRPLLTIVGLGPGNIDQLTPQALKALQGASPVFLRTAVHPLATRLGIPFSSFDHFYEKLESLEAVYQAIVAAVIEALETHTHVVYAVPGHPLVAEATTQALIAEHRLGDFELKIIPGLSYLEAAYTSLGIDPLAGLQIGDALYLPQSLNPRQPLLLAQIYSPRIASDVKLQLLDIFPETHEVILLKNLGLDNEQVQSLPLVELDRDKQIDHLCTLYVPALENLPQEAYGITRAISELVDVVRRLRDPVDGCPWDLAQTPLSLCKYIIEEAYETVDAIESNDDFAIEEELGDLLLQIVLQAQIFSESEVFDLGGVAEAITQKLIRRHPHVFGDVTVQDAEEVNRNWDAIKAQEKGNTPETLAGKLLRLSRQMPALMASAEISKKVAKVGFEWPDHQGVWDKLQEEISELKTAIAEESTDRQSAELGDVLFTLINVARWQRIDLEKALRETNRRFLSRFAIVEELANGKLEDCSLEQLEIFWQQAKRRLSD
ncbi:MAG: nucleoside triphosphate pyrophosphohydrolase [Anaerolineae bacterium]|nr:nucleoside triphosphate pyrophosphohydrolase [Gloeobacterales cyanobacterium ES-bin-313]